MNSFRAVMMLDKARDLLQTQVDFSGFYNRHGAKMILAELSKKHGQGAVDRFITGLELEAVFPFPSGDTIEMPA